MTELSPISKFKLGEISQTKNPEAYKVIVHSAKKWTQEKHAAVKRRQEYRAFRVSAAALQDPSAAEETDETLLPSGVAVATNVGSVRRR